MPNTRPCMCGGNHLLTKGTPTANELPASPRKNPQKRSPPKDPPISPINSTGMISTSMRAVKTARPPKRSVRRPMGMRNREPRITGVAMTMLIWVLDSSYSSWNRVASGATSPHTAKHRAKASVDSTRAVYAPARGPPVPTELIPTLLPNRDPDPVASPDLRSYAEHIVQTTRKRLYGRSYAFLLHIE